MRAVHAARTGRPIALYGLPAAAGTWPASEPGSSESTATCAAGGHRGHDSCSNRRPGGPMRPKVGRISIGDPEAREAIAAALAALECAVGEQWTVRMGALPHGGWELVLQGPERDHSSNAGWQARPLGAGRARHRCVLRGAQKRVEYVESAVRQLLWASIQFPDNPFWSHDPALGRAFEQAVWTVLREQAEGPVYVRFN